MPPRKHKNKKSHHQRQQQQVNKSNSSKKETSNIRKESEDYETTNIQLPYKLEHSNIVGRYLVASRELKAGELLLIEEPLAIGPCVSSDAVCLGCYKPVKLNGVQYRCTSCCWPLCSVKCKGLYAATGHTIEECDLLKAQKNTTTLSATTSATIVKNLYELILIVRILLMKQHSPEKYAKIMLMESHSELRKQNADLWQHYQQNVVTKLLDEWHMASYTADEIHTVCGILDVNCFEIGQNSAKARTLYPNAFLLAHDCSPNTSHTDDPNTFAIVLRTSRHVQKDEALTLSYAYTLQGTLKRRDFMHAGKLFWCFCQRCSDPMELGTDCSAIICAKCKKGSLRSSDPLNQDADWICDNCDNTLISKDLVNLLDKINDDLESIDVHDVSGLENFLKRYAATLKF
ncbi:SET domain-containing protein SmydA-8-like [Teleopsis dalmanni]|uniref:SET domain-containing protein SmydA-8-like n=1 Tax=Teleopsis dalmanni TaxID=139649 RepID=UPI0018CCC15E|nr:SET domain-containing protein SmydA-8-like [Teleopsis dalmanni]